MYRNKNPLGELWVENERMNNLEPDIPLGRANSFFSKPPQSAKADEATVGILVMTGRSSAKAAERSAPEEH